MAFLLGSALGFGASTLLGASPLQNQVEYSLNTLFPNKILSPPDIVDLFRREHLTKALYYEMMRYLGYNEAQARLYYRSQDSLLTAEQAISHRIAKALSNVYEFEAGNVTKSELDANLDANVRDFGKRMNRQGYVVSEANAMFEAGRPLPTLGTILSWMAKEVFEPTAIAKFQYDQEVPPQLIQYMNLYGIPRAEAIKYWIEHWQPIGYGQWKELYQRLRDDRTDIDEATIRSTGANPANVRISKSDFEEFFKVLEVSPYFRDRMIATAFDPIPFSTLQQAYQYGIINDSRLLGYLKDYGYSDSSANIILQTWQRKFPFKAREALANNILLQQKRGYMTKAQARAALVAQSVPADIAAYQTNIIDEGIEEQRIKWRLANLAIRLGRGAITDAEMATAVDGFIADTERRAFEKENIRIRAERYLRRITPRQLTRGVSDGTITIAQARAALASMRMPASDIDLLVPIMAGDGEGDGEDGEE